MSLSAVCFLSISILQAAERPQRVKSQAVPQPLLSAAPSILSIIPAQGEPGSKVTIFGGGFGELASVILGSVEIAAGVTGGKQLEFVIPKLDSGLYALYIKRGDGTTGRVYNFTVQPLRPVLSSLAQQHQHLCPGDWP